MAWEQSAAARDTTQENVARTSGVFEAAFLADDGQLAFIAGGRGEELVTFHSHADVILNNELIDRGPVRITVAMVDEDHPDRVDLVTGWATDFEPAMSESQIVFEDGFTVPYFDVFAIRIG